jgi:hypothetical protein
LRTCFNCGESSSWRWGRSSRITKWSFK